MRLNDPQIELVHDDPFMGYIETARSGTGSVSKAPHSSVSSQPTTLMDIAEEDATNSAVVPAEEDEEEVDVGENSRPIPVVESVPRGKSPECVGVSVRNNNRNSESVTSSDASTERPIVIVLLVE